MNTNSAKMNPFVPIEKRSPCENCIHFDICELKPSFKELREKTSNLELKASDGKILKISELRGLNLTVTCDYYLEKSQIIAFRGEH